MNDAVYVASVDKIFGVVGPYVCKYNATTGAREGFVRVASPLAGDVRICYHAANDTLYVSTLWQPNQQYDGAFFPTNEFLNRDVFPVSTSLVVGARLGLWSINYVGPPYGGYQWIGSFGTHIYLAFSTRGNTGSPSYWGMQRVNPTNLADKDGLAGSIRFRPEHCGFSPTEIAIPNPNILANNTHITVAPTDLSNSDEVYVTPNVPCAAEYCAANGLFYVVCGTTNLLRIDTTTPFPGSFTSLNLGAIEATADPCRIRYRALDQKLYCPCMSSNTVIVWDPATETGIAKTGFENPCDVVFSASKAWAVQNAPIGLKEITP